MANTRVEIDPLNINKDNKQQVADFLQMPQPPMSVAAWNQIDFRSPLHDQRSVIFTNDMIRYH